MCKDIIPIIEFMGKRLFTVILLSLFVCDYAFACSLSDVSGCPNFMDLVSDAIARGDTSLTITNPFVRVNVGDATSFPVSIQQYGATLTGFIVHGIESSGRMNALSLTHYNSSSQMNNLWNSGFESDNVLFKIVNVEVSRGASEWINDNTRWRNTYTFFITTTRRTEYRIILNDDRGYFLDAVRRVGANRNLLHKLDSAQSMSEINKIMARSVVFNPGLMLRPVKLLSQFKNSVHAPNGLDVGASTTGIFGGGLHAGVLSGHADKKLGALRLGVFVHASEMQYRGMDNFNATVFGAGVNAKLDMDRFYVSGRLGIDYTEFQTEFIFCPKNFATYNPIGISGHAEIIAGYRLNRFITPMVRAHKFYGRILYEEYQMASVSSGARASHNVRTSSNIEKTYSAYFLMGTNYTQGGIRIDAVMPRDDISAFGSINRISNSFGNFNKVQMGFRYLF